MIPEESHMLTFVEAAEAAMHGEGWDQPPLLAYVTKVNPADLPKSAREKIEAMPGAVAAYGISPFPMQPHEVSQDTGRGLMKLAAMSLSPGAPGIVPPRMVDSVAGLIVILEAWMNNDPESRGDPRALADIPGSVEMRYAMLMDCGGRTYVCTRVRGKEPEIEQAGAVLEVAGRVALALRSLMIAMCRQLGPGEIDAEKIIGKRRSSWTTT